MKFRTEIIPPNFDFKLNFNSKIITVGSCFSEVIGQHLQNSKCKVLINPFGNIYNVASIAEIIKNAIFNHLPKDNHFIKREEMYFHLDYHSAIYNKNKDSLLQEIKNRSEEFRNYLQTAQLLIITLGTSWIYEYENVIISNCHKIPAEKFKKRLLGYNEQLALLKEMISNIRELNPNIKIIFTVSPVRHTKDGLSENNLSKSILRVLCHEICTLNPEVYYFPSFEIMMDDLRDYRFYKSDFIHPSETAEEYICEVFNQSMFSPELLKVLKDWKKTKLGLSHRPFNPEARSYQTFLINLSENIKRFEKYFDVTTELQKLEAQLPLQN